MNILYLSPVSYPSGFANRVQLMKMSEAFSRVTNFTLVLGKFPERADDIWKTYHVTHPFTVRALGVPLLYPKSFWFGLRARREVARAEADTIFYVRDVLLACVLIATSRRFRAGYVFELHTLARFPKFVYRFVLARAKLIVTTNAAKRDDLLKMGFLAERILLAPNGVDMEEIQGLPSKEKARQALGWPLEGFILAYIGTVAPAYGSSVLEEIPALLGQNERLEVVTGRPRQEAILALAAADALIAPYEPINEHIAKYMSPMKVREYLASGKPMIVSDVPAIRETVGEDEAWFMRAGSAEDAVRCVREIRDDAERVARVQSAMARKAATLSWDARAQAIISAITHALA